MVTPKGIYVGKVSENMTEDTNSNHSVDPDQAISRDPDQKDTKKKQTDPPLTAREEWIEFGKVGVVAFFLAILIRTFLLEPFNIPSGSMKPTLLVGDYLFVSKPSYGFSKHSFPFSFAPIEDRILYGDRMPERGDVIVFKLPKNPRIDFIKRIVALPGDTVQVKEGRLYLNDQIVPRKAIGLTQDIEGFQKQTVTEYVETLPNGYKHLIYETSDSHPLDNTKKFTVPAGHYFVMGDNRDNSTDSRVQDEVGFIPYENIVGRAAFLFFSTNGNASLAEFWKWPATVRYERLFRVISPKLDKDKVAKAKE